MTHDHAGLEDKIRHVIKEVVTNFVSENPEFSTIEIAIGFGSLCPDLAKAIAALGRAPEAGALDPHYFGSKAGDPDWCHWCGENRNHPAHAPAPQTTLAEKCARVRADAALASAKRSKTGE